MSKKNPATAIWTERVVSRVQNLSLSLSPCRVWCREADVCLGSFLSKSISQ